MFQSILELVRIWLLLERVIDDAFQVSEGGLERVRGWRTEV